MVSFMIKCFCRKVDKQRPVDLFRNRNSEVHVSVISHKSKCVSNLFALSKLSSGTYNVLSFFESTWGNQ